MFIVSVDVPYYPYIKRFICLEEAFEWVKEQNLDEDIKQWNDLGHNASYVISRAIYGAEYGDDGVWKELET